MRPVEPHIKTAEEKEIEAADTRRKQEAAEAESAQARKAAAEREELRKHKRGVKARVDVASIAG